MFYAKQSHLLMKTLKVIDQTKTILNKLRNSAAENQNNEGSVKKKYVSLISMILYLKSEF